MILWRPWQVHHIRRLRHICLLQWRPTFSHVIVACYLLNTMTMVIPDDRVPLSLHLVLRHRHPASPCRLLLRMFHHRRFPFRNVLPILQHLMRHNTEPLRLSRYPLRHLRHPLRRRIQLPPPSRLLLRCLLLRRHPYRRRQVPLLRRIPLLDHLDTILLLVALLRQLLVVALLLLDRLHHMVLVHLDLLGRPDLPLRRQLPVLFVRLPISSDAIGACTALIPVPLMLS